MINRNLIIILLVSLITSRADGTQSSPDSLRVLYKSAPVNSLERLQAATQLAEYWLNTDADSAARYARIGIDLALKTGYYPGIFENSCTLGKIMMRRDSLEQAVALFEDARQQIDNLEIKNHALCVLLLLGYVYDVQKDFFKSHQVLYEGLRIAENTGDSAFIWSYYNNLGAHYYQMADYNNSIKMLRMGLKVYENLDPSQRKFSLASTLNNIAGSFLDLGYPDSAMFYLELALQMPGLDGEYYGQYNLYGNLGKALQLKGEPEKALAQYKKAGAALDSLKGNFKGSMAPLYASHYRHIGLAYFDKGDLSTARRYLLDALKYSELASDIEVKSETLLNLSQIEEKYGDLQGSLSLMKEYLTVRDTLVARQAAEKIAQVTLRYQFDKDMEAKEYEMEVNELRHRRRELVLLFTLMTVTGVLITLFLLYRLQRNRARRKHLEEKTVRLENEKISEELDYKNKELTTNVLYLLKKNEMIASISQQLNVLMVKMGEESTRNLRGIINQLDKETEEIDAWKEFELRFKEVHSDFYQKLSRDYPLLTAQELRLCAFLRLNMTNKEIASITFQTTESLKTARYRLRKKLGINRDENLVAFLIRL
jgi:tetratricopeptide (TPR) repeat protein